MSRMDQVNIRFPKKLMARIDQAVVEGGFVNRQDLIRVAIRELLEKLERESYTGP